MSMSTKEVVTLLQAMLVCSKEVNDIGHVLYHADDEENDKTPLSDLIPLGSIKHLIKLAQTATALGELVEFEVGADEATRRMTRDWEAAEE